jgi:hypothetical protein
MYSLEVEGRIYIAMMDSIMPKKGGKEVMYKFLATASNISTVARDMKYMCVARKVRGRGQRADYISQGGSYRFHTARR